MWVKFKYYISIRSRWVFKWKKVCFTNFTNKLITRLSTIRLCSVLHVRFSLFELLVKSTVIFTYGNIRSFETDFKSRNRTLSRFPHKLRDWFSYDNAELLDKGDN